MGRVMPHADSARKPYRRLHISLSPIVRYHAIGDYLFFHGRFADSTSWLYRRNDTHLVDANLEWRRSSIRLLYAYETYVPRPYLPPPRPIHGHTTLHGPESAKAGVRRNDV